MSTSVELTVRPRKATPDEPAAKPLPNAVGIVPLESLVSDRTMSATFVRPLSSIFSRDKIVTGEAVLKSCCLIIVPVTVTVSMVP